MKKILLIIGLVSSVMIANAQSPIGKDGKQLNMGVGITGHSVPVYFGLDFGVHRDITLGFEMSYRGYNDTYWDGHHHEDVHHNIIGLSGNFNYHFNSVLEIPQTFDFYAGFDLGYYVWTTNDKDYNGDGASGLGLGLQIGGRYYFTKKVGLNLELGGPFFSAGGKFGVSFKL